MQLKLQTPVELQLWTQPPPEHEKSQFAPPLHVWLQPLPEHEKSQFDPPLQIWLQLPLTQLESQSDDPLQVWLQPVWRPPEHSKSQVLEASQVWSPSPPVFPPLRTKSPWHEFKGINGPAQFAVIVFPEMLPLQLLAPLTKLKLLPETPPETLNAPLEQVKLALHPVCETTQLSPGAMQVLRPTGP